MPARRKLRHALIAAAIAALVMLPARAAGSSDSVQFEVVPGPVGYGAGPQGETEPPGVPAAPLGLSEQPQSFSTRMADFRVVDASGSGSGWNITVSGEGGHDRSPVLRQYCRSSTCGRHAGPGYVADGIALPPNSLTLDSSGARFRSDSPDAGEPPENACGQTCFIDTPATAPSKIAEAPAGSGMGMFEASGFADSSFRLMAPSSPTHLSQGEIYRVDVSWSLNTGP